MEERLKCIFFRLPSEAVFHLPSVSLCSALYATQPFNPSTI
jgi:hypothetical protein